MLYVYISLNEKYAMQLNSIQLKLNELIFFSNLNHTYSFAFKFNIIYIFIFIYNKSCSFHFFCCTYLCLFSYARAAEKGVSRAIQAGCKAPLLFFAVADEKRFPQAGLVAVLGGLAATYVPLETREQVGLEQGTCYEAILTKCFSPDR